MFLCKPDSDSDSNSDSNEVGVGIGFRSPVQDTTPKPSFIWNYFGHLHKKPNELLDNERIYCKVCFDKLKGQQPDATFSSIRRNIGVYNSKSGAGNMKNHLLAVHRISEPQQTKTTN
jgi:hypothetical protein